MRLTFLCALGAFVSPAAAMPIDQIEARYSAAFNECMGSGDAARGVTPAMLACISDEYKVQDTRLNQAYKMVTKRLNASRKAKLRESERQWIKTRDATCKQARDSYDGGSMAPIVWGTCRTNETIKRTMWLENYR